MEKDGKNIKPETFSVDVLLPHYVIEDFKAVAQFHEVKIEEVIIRALLTQHALMIAELIQNDTNK